ncbi:MAG: sulfatase [Armatimonadetes bacterium]|nr:sulfatase [Armatimonadota bacterium]
MNVVIVIVDSLRYDHLGAHGNDWIRTPNLDRLAAESWVFDGAFMASFPTIPHRTDVITGQYGAPFHPWLPLRWDRVTFPALLREAGWATQLVHDTPHLVNGGHNFDFPFQAWYQVRGAEVDRPWLDDSREWPDNWTRDPLFDFVEQEPQQVRLVPTYVRANRGRERDEDWNCARLFSAAADCVRRNASRDDFLLWVDCFDPHEPWDVPPEYARMYSDDPDWDGRIDPRSFAVEHTEGAPEQAVRRIIAQYAGKVSWVDRWLGLLLDALDDTGMAERTMLVLTADHGTNLAERGRFSKWHPVKEQEAHVPLMIRTPEGDGGRCDCLVQPQDLFATITSAAGVPLPDGVESFDVLAAAREGSRRREVALAAAAPRPRWSEPGFPLFTVFDGEWYLHLTARPEDSQLFHMGSVDDVAAEHPDLVQRLHAAGLEEIARRDIDTRLLEWLRSGGEARFPEDARFFEGWPGPPGYKMYFQNANTDW